MDTVIVRCEVHTNLGGMTMICRVMETFLCYAIDTSGPGCVQPSIEEPVKSDVDRPGFPELVTKFLQGDAQSEIFDR